MTQFTFRKIDCLNTFCSWLQVFTAASRWVRSKDPEYVIAVSSTVRQRFLFISYSVISMAVVNVSPQPTISRRTKRHTFVNRTTFVLSKTVDKASQRCTSSKSTRRNTSSKTSYTRVTLPAVASSSSLWVIITHILKAIMVNDLMHVRLRDVENGLPRHRNWSFTSGRTLVRDHLYAKRR